MISSKVFCLQPVFKHVLVNFNEFPLSGTNSNSRMRENPPGGQSGQRQGRHRSCPNGQLDDCPQSIERGTITHDSNIRRQRPTPLQPSAHLQSKTNEALQEANSSSLQSFTFQALPSCVELQAFIMHKLCIDPGSLYLIFDGDQVQFYITFVVPGFQRSHDKTKVRCWSTISLTLCPLLASLPTT